eukprot:3683191-Ditylum_brightwellii.AAC.1
MSKLPPRPDFDAVLDALDPSPSALPCESNTSNFSYVDAAATTSLCSTWLFKEEGGALPKPGFALGLRAMLTIFGATSGRTFAQIYIYGMDKMQCTVAPCYQQIRFP